MDTRSKIVPLASAASRASGVKTVVLLSSFDVLTAARIRCVQQAVGDADLLIVIIAEAPGSLLPAQARAELAASLGLVDLVVKLEEKEDEPLTHFSGAQIIDDAERDRQRTVELIEYVHQRNRAERE